MTLHPVPDGETRWVWICGYHGALLALGDVDIVRWVNAQTMPIEVPDAPPLA
jgi:hypothetical protein